jgi:hypothetical protein
MDEELREMLDHFRIRKVLATYCRGSDRCDGNLAASVYARDSWDDHGVIRAPGQDFARQMCRMVVETTETLTHMLGQSLITVTGEEAGAETYFMATSHDTGPEGAPMCNHLGGRFIDRLVREDGSWKIRHRTVLRDWSVALPVAHDWELSHTLQHGGRSAADLSYAVLEPARSE